VTAVPPDKKDQYELAVELFVSMASLPPDDPTEKRSPTRSSNCAYHWPPTSLAATRGAASLSRTWNKLRAWGWYRLCSDST